MGKRAAHPLVKHGSSVAVIIPRWLLGSLGWLCGDLVVEELLEDNTLRIRPIADAALRAKEIPRFDPSTVSTEGR